MAHELIEKISRSWPPERWKDVTVLVAVSGGADSVALARALAEIRVVGNGRLVLGHFNHRLRGAESDGDEQFVTRIASELGCEAIVGARSGDLPDSAGGLSLEGLARQARYDFLTSAAMKSGARFVVTAHTADDQAETVLHRILRGTGLAGLAGIPRTRVLGETVTLLRPLLTVTRAEVVDYLAEIVQTYRQDSTNASEDFTRNRIRHTLLPQLERDFNPKVREALLRLAQVAGQADEFLTDQAEKLLDEAAWPISRGVALSIIPISAAHPAVLRQALLLIWRQQEWPLADMSLAKWEQLAELAQGGSPGSILLPSRVEARLGDSMLQLTRHD